jgi:hypothetical protein
LVDVPTQTADKDFLFSIPVFQRQRLTINRGDNLSEAAILRYERPALRKPFAVFQRIQRWREHLSPSSRRSSRFQTVPEAVSARHRRLADPARRQWRCRVEIVWMPVFIGTPTLWPLAPEQEVAPSELDGVHAHRRSGTIVIPERYFLLSVMPLAEVSGRRHHWRMIFNLRLGACRSNRQGGAIRRTLLFSLALAVVALGIVYFVSM